MTHSFFSFLNLDGTITSTPTSRRSNGRPQRTSVYSNCTRHMAIAGPRSQSTYLGGQTIILRIITIRLWNARLSKGRDSKEWSWYIERRRWNSRMCRYQWRDCLEMCRIHWIGPRLSKDLTILDPRCTTMSSFLSPVRQPRSIMEEITQQPITISTLQALSAAQPKTKWCLCKAPQLPWQGLWPRHRPIWWPRIHKIFTRRLSRSRVESSCMSLIRR